MADSKNFKATKHFCILPWLHFHAWPDGSIFPCCLAKSDIKFGNLNTQGVAEFINSEPFKKLRKNMLADLPSGNCQNCYALEAQADNLTLRKSALETFKNKIDEVTQNTETDGAVKNFKLSYMDIRFSNLCNFKCRTCGPDFSSAWQEEFRAKGEDVGPIPKQIYKAWEQIEPYLDDVEEVYFAGGEPLISPEHYRLLEYWIKKGRTNVRLRYTTNFSHFKFKSYNLIDLWKEFQDVRVAASLDAEGPRGEYIRKGTNWNQIVKNREEMLSLCPQIYFEITPTISAFNVLNLPAFHRSWVEKGLLDPKNIRINYLFDPEIYSAKILPQTLKLEAQKIYTEHIAFLEGLEKNNLEQTIDSFAATIKFFNSEDCSNRVQAFLEKNGSVDNTRGENFFDTFPELRDLK